MTAAAEPKTAATWRDAVALYLRPRVLIVLLLGFSSGLPLALSGSTLAVWLRESDIDLGTIGLFTIVGTPYTIKFLWAPVVDALDVPVLSRLFGRRRGWLVLSQLLLMAAIVLLALCNPRISSITMIFGAAFLVAAASATQDIVIDAFRVESLNVDEQAAGMASYVAAYRVGMLVSTAGALYVVSAFEWIGAGRNAAWTLGYVVMAAAVAVGIVTSIAATEPERSAAASSERALHAKDHPLKRVTDAAIGAFADFLTRNMAFVVLAFVVLYKFCDAFAGAMTTPFVIDLGFDRIDYANFVKGIGLAATLIGGFAGGFVARAYPLATCLWIGAALQMVSNLVFVGLAYAKLNYWALGAAIVAENFTGAIGTVIFVAYLSALCQSPLHTATQYALLTALAAVGRTYLSSGAGYLAEWAGWPLFFMISTLTAVPSLLLLWWLQTGGHFRTLLPPKVLAAAD